MAQTEKASVIRRMTREARGGADSRAMSPVSALRLALARAADTLIGLPLLVATVEQRRVETGEIETTFGAEGLFLLLDGVAGARAAMRLCPSFVAAVIEMQTTGRIRPGEARARLPTRTDAALLAPIVDAILAGIDQAMAERSAEAAQSGFHFGDKVEDARALALLLMAPEFDFFRVTADLGPGLRTGRMELALPRTPAKGVRTDGVATQGGAGTGAPYGRKAHAREELTLAALPATVRLEAVLTRIRLPLSTAMALEVGQHLKIPSDNLHTVHLEGPGGHAVIEAQLGRRNGWRALRLLGAGAQGRPGDTRDRKGTQSSVDSSDKTEIRVARTKDSVGTPNAMKPSKPLLPMGGEEGLDKDRRDLKQDNGSAVALAPLDD